eukprot:663188-Rhodomonas_salina.4
MHSQLLILHRKDPSLCCIQPSLFRLHLLPHTQSGSHLPPPLLSPSYRRLHPSEGRSAVEAREGRERRVRRNATDG